MNKQSIQKHIKACNNSFESVERTNFKNLWEDCAGLCRPIGNTILGVRTAGEQKNINRLADIGITSLNTFTSGLASTLVPKGSKFFEYSLSKTVDLGMNTNEVKRWLNDCSRITMDYVNESNFFTEAVKSFSDLGLIGTSLLLTEGDPEEGIRFKSYYIDSFAFTEDAVGRVDTVYFKLNFTARQIMLKFGDEALTDKLRRALDNNDDTQHSVIHTIFRRDNYTEGTLNPLKKRYGSLYILESDVVVLKESGFSQMPASVTRWSQASNESHGRAPASDCIGNLQMVNTMEYTKLRSAQRVANPQWLLPDDGSVRNLNNNSGGVVYYNASTGHKPEQIRPQDNPQLTDVYIQQRKQDIENAFFVPIFNPLVGAGNQMTATEVDRRISIANQNLVPNIARVVDEGLEPTFKRIFFILLESGLFPVAPTSFDARKVRVTFTSKATLALRKIETAGVFSALESISFLAQMDESALDYINVDEIVKLTAEANGMPSDTINSDFDVKKIRAARAKANQDQEELANSAEMAKAYSSTSKGADPNSPAGLLLSDAGLQ